MKKIFLRVLLWVLQLIYTQYAYFQSFKDKILKFLYDFCLVFIGGKGVYVRTRLSQVMKQPKHLILSFPDSRDEFELFSQQLSQNLLLISFTKTYIVTIYDASGNLQEKLLPFLEILKKTYFGGAPSKKFFIMSSKPSHTVFMLDYNKGGQVKELNLDSIPAKVIEEGDYPFIINILGPLDSYDDFVRNIMMKNNENKTKMEDLRMALACNKPMKLLRNLEKKMSMTEYDTSLLLAFSEGIHSCLGIPFDLLGNAEIMFQKNFKDCDSLTILRSYIRYSTTKQRRGK